MSSAPFRESDLAAECERLRKRVSELEALVHIDAAVPFDSACPYCGSRMRVIVKRIDTVGAAQLGAEHITRTFVAAKRVGAWWSRRTVPAHFLVKCGSCLGEFREAMKGAAK